MRKIIQVIEGPVVLCEDGTLWYWSYKYANQNVKQWIQYPPIPEEAQ